jgi:hypothetical protein
MSWGDVLGAVAGAVIAGGIGTYTAVRMDRLNARRERMRREEHERAVARLISSELRSAHEAAEKAVDGGRWPLWRQPLRRYVWDRHAHVLASRITRDAFDQLARTYEELGGWQNRVSLYLAQFPASSLMNLDGDLPEEHESVEMLDTLRRNLEVSHRDIQPVAFPDGHNTA